MGVFVTSEIIYPIHVAARLGDYEMLRLLVKAGADMEQVSSRGRTAYELAVKARADENVLDFLRSGARIVPLRSLKKLVQEQGELWAC